MDERMEDRKQRRVDRLMSHVHPATAIRLRRRANDKRNLSYTAVNS